MVKAASILIADDEEVFRETTADLLRLRGYRCDCVAGTQTALAALEEQPFDLLIADIRMPGNAGLQLVEELQRDRPGLPIILVTGAPSLDSAIHSVHLPVAAYLTKPLDLESFYGHVDRCVAQSTTRSVLHDARRVFLECAERIENMEEEVSSGVQTPHREGDRRGRQRGCSSNARRPQIPRTSLAPLRGRRMRCNPGPGHLAARNCVAGSG